MGFIGVQTLASAHMLCLPTNSVQVFQVGSNFQTWMKSEASLHTEGSIGVMKLGVQPLESAFGVDFQDSKGEVLEYKYMAGEIVQVDAVLYSRWS